MTTKKAKAGQTAVYQIYSLRRDGAACRKKFQALKCVTLGDDLPAVLDI